MGIGVVFEQVLIIVAFVSIGFFLSKKKILREKSSTLLSKLTIWLFTPCMVFRSFSRYFTVENIKKYYPILLAGFLSVIALALFCSIALRFTKLRHYDKNILTYTIVVPNFSYIGYAFAESIFGLDGQFLVILFCLPLSLFTYTVGYYILTHPEKGSGKFSFKALINPLIISVVLSAVWGLIKIPVPHILEEFTTKGAACVAPITMLLTGIVISRFSIVELLKKKYVYFIVLLRLIIIPLAVYFSLRFIPFFKDALIPALLVSCMPCGMNPIVYAKSINEDCRLGASLVLISTILSLATIPLCMSFVI